MQGYMVWHEDQGVLGKLIWDTDEILYANEDQANQAAEGPRYNGHRTRVISWAEMLGATQYALKNRVTQEV